MNKKAWLLSGVSLAFMLLTGCKSNQEAAGDKFRKAGDPINALMQYEEALRRGKVSREFWDNYTQINIAAMGLRANEDPTAEFLDILKDTISSLLSQHPSPVNEVAFSKTLTEIGLKRLAQGGPLAEEGAFNFFKTAEGLAGKSGEISSQISQARQSYVSNKLKEAQDELASSEETAGIVADYKMNELFLKLGEETPEMRSLWSEIRKKNLNTYLMYDLEGLLPEVDARINKHGVLLGIVKYEPSAKTVKIQVKAFNGSSQPIHFVGEGFTLVDRAGKALEPSAKIGHFSTKDVIQARDESKVGGLTFNLESGFEPYYLEYKSEGGTSRKYLP